MGCVRNLGALGGRALSFEPALDAGEAEQVAAAQSGQPVVARRRPRLEADGAGVAFALLAVGRLDWSCWNRLQPERRTVRSETNPQADNQRKSSCMNIREGHFGEIPWKLFKYF